MPRRLAGRAPSLPGLLLALLLGLAVARWPLWLAGGVVAASAALLLLLRQPLAGLALALIAGPRGAVESLALGSSLVDSGQVFFWLAVAAWLAHGVLRRRIVLPRTPLNLPLALFTGLMLLTLWQAPSPLFGLVELLKWVEIGLVMLLVVDLAAGLPAFWRERALVAMLLLAGMSQAAIGLWQFGLRGQGPEHFLILGRFYRAFGTFNQPNPFGGFMSLNALLGAGTLLGLLGQAWQRRSLGSWGEAAWLFFVAVATAATALGVIASWSRGAWLGFAAGGLVLALFWPQRRRRGVVLLLAGLALVGLAWRAGLVPASLSSRLGSVVDEFRLGDVRGVDINDANFAVIERLAHWQAALDMARDHLWLGVGFGNYEPAYPAYALVNWPNPLGHAHNYYLNILAEAGVAGIMAYLAFWAAVFWQSLRLLRQLPWPQRGVALGLLAAWAALSVHHLVDKLYVNNMYVHLGVMLGLQQGLERPGAIPAEV